MLDLDSSQWNKLEHAYGSAEDIPALLRQLATLLVISKDYQSEPWFSLWSALCHQNDVYSASFAAVPHLVELAATKTPENRAEFVLLVSCIEIGRYRTKSPHIPPELKKDYLAALQKMKTLILEGLNHKTDNEEDAKLWLGALAVMNGLPNLGNAILELPAANECPECGAEVPPLGYELD